MSSFKSNENIHKKDGSYYVVSANKASSVTLKPADWKAFLTNEDNKKQLVHVLLNAWDNDAYAKSCRGERLFLSVRAMHIATHLMMELRQKEHPWMG